MSSMLWMGQYSCTFIWNITYNRESTQPSNVFRKNSRITRTSSVICSDAEDVWQKKEKAACHEIVSSYDSWDRRQNAPAIMVCTGTGHLPTYIRCQLLWSQLMKIDLPRILTDAVLLEEWNDPRFWGPAVQIADPMVCSSRALVLPGQGWVRPEFCSIEFVLTFLVDVLRSRWTQCCAVVRYLQAITKISWEGSYVSDFLLDCKLVWLES